MNESVVSKLCAGDPQCLALQIPPTLFFFLLEFYSLVILSLLNCLCVTCGQNASILDRDIVIFTDMFSLLKNSITFSLGVLQRLAALVSPGMPIS